MFEKNHTSVFAGDVIGERIKDGRPWSYLMKNQNRRSTTGSEE